MKAKKVNETETRNQQAQETVNKDKISDSDSDEAAENIELDQQDTNIDPHKQSFRRHFNNLDMATCWLNSCLQLILTAMDHSLSTASFTSELGKELSFLQNS